MDDFSSISLTQQKLTGEEQLLSGSIKLYNNKIYNGPNVFARLEDLCIRSVEISKNDVYKNAGNAIELVGVHTFNNEIRRVLIKENLIQETI